jgi:hypothetical protein
MDEPEEEGDGVADVGTTVAAAVFGEVAVAVEAVGEGVAVVGFRVTAFVGTYILLSEPVSWDNILIVPSGNTCDWWQLCPTLPSTPIPKPTRQFRGMVPSQ